MSFLETWQKKHSGNDIDHLKVYAKDRDVIIIGGGDTGVDCIATSLRQVSAYTSHRAKEFRNNQRVVQMSEAALGNASARRTLYDWHVWR